MTPVVTMGRGLGGMVVAAVAGWAAVAAGPLATVLATAPRAASTRSAGGGGPAAPLAVAVMARGTT